MTELFLFEPQPSPAWFPFQDSRPICELRAGAWLIRERWEAVVGEAAKGIFGLPHLIGFAEDDTPPVTAPMAVDGPACVARSDFAPTGVAPDAGEKPARLVNDGTTVAWWIPAGSRWTAADQHDDWPPVEIEGMLLRGSFDLVTALEHFLHGDVADFTSERGEPVPDNSLVIGDPADVVVLGAAVEPGVVFDVRAGAVVVEQHAYVKNGTRLEGPLYIGPGTEVHGGQLGRCAFGPRCKVRGEMSSAVFLGYANKVHDGFVGHSVIGRWANLGAGTTTSNLKNTYGEVRLEAAEARIDTGRQYLGSLIGDHVKTAIGTMLGTGTVVGMGANVFGDVRPPKYVPAFAWGTTGESVDLERFLSVAERVMKRRQVECTEAVRGFLSAAYHHATGA